jgi:hypothetical protein
MAYPPHHRHLAAFQRGNVKDLRAKIAELLSLPRMQWQILSQAARETAIEAWSWDVVANRIASLARTPATG